jgi:hypothetical protein
MAAKKKMTPPTPRPKPKSGPTIKPGAAAAEVVATTAKTAGKMIDTGIYTAGKIIGSVASYGQSSKPMGQRMVELALGKSGSKSGSKVKPRLNSSAPKKNPVSKSDMSMLPKPKGSLKPAPKKPTPKKLPKTR